MPPYNITMLSYLPYPHSFEQALLGFVLTKRARVGFYCGDPLRIIDDCQTLKPHCFPTVPRLLTKIYSKLRDGFDATTGCKKWLVDRALSSKMYHYQTSNTLTHGCWDTLVFKKIRAVLGGNILFMLSGSAPIEKQVLDFLKVCFSCPV